MWWETVSLLEPQRQFILVLIVFTIFFCAGYFNAYLKIIGAAVKNVCQNRLRSPRTQHFVCSSGLAQSSLRQRGHWNLPTARFSYESMKIIFIFIFGFIEGSLALKVYLMFMVAFIIPALAWSGWGKPWGTSYLSMFLSISEHTICRTQSKIYTQPTSNVQ